MARETDRQTLLRENKETTERISMSVNNGKIDVIKETENLKRMRVFNSELDIQQSGKLQRYGNREKAGVYDP